MAAMALCAENKLELAILRPFHVYGEGEQPHRFWPSLRVAATSGKDFEMTLGEQIRDFIDVADAAHEFLKFVTKKLTPGDAYIKNIGTGHPMTLRNFAEHWWTVFGGKGKIIYGAVPYREGEIMHYVPDVSNE
jgi:nucleoside-diphosphate-sugar epimerase